jgi:hypothetical protein
MEDLPQLSDVEALMDDLMDVHGAYRVVLEAYAVAQPKPRERNLEKEAEDKNTLIVKRTPDEDEEPQGFKWGTFLEQGVQCGLKPVEFWSMTPEEVTLFIEGYQWRIDEFGEMWAHFTSNQMNVHIQKKLHKVQPRQLWQSRRKQQKEYRNPDELKAERRDIMHTMKKSGVPLPKKMREHRADKDKQ